MDVITWNHLAIHERPVVVLNVEGYYGRVLACVKALYMFRPNRELFWFMNWPARS
jgi:predicted Rossmann-fold nucleotide-binding protein